MLRKPKFYIYRNGDLVQFFNEVRDLMDDETAEDLLLKPQRDAFVAVFDQLYDEWHVHSSNPLTPDIARLDKKRDDAFIAFRTLLRSYAKMHPDPDVPPMAKYVLKRVDAHGRMFYRLRMQLQSAITSAIILELRGPLADKINYMNLNDWVDFLENTNNELGNIINSRTETRSQRAIGLTEKLKAEGKQKYNDFVKMFEVRMTIAQLDDDTLKLNRFRKLENSWNQLVKEINEAVKQSHLKEKNQASTQEFPSE